MVKHFSVYMAILISTIVDTNHTNTFVYMAILISTIVDDTPYSEDYVVYMAILISTIVDVKLLTFAYTQSIWPF